MICVAQERNLRSLTSEAMKNETGVKNVKEKPKNQPVKDNDKSGVKPPFPYLNIPPTDQEPLRDPQYLSQQQRPHVANAYSPYDPVHMYDPWGGPPLPQGRSPYQPGGGPPLPYGPSPYQSGGAHEAYYGYDP